MTQKQFNAIKAQIDKTNTMIENAINKTNNDIEKRVEKLIEKMTINFPILVQTVKECGMRSVRFCTDKFDGFIDREYASKRIQININKKSHNSMTTELIYSSWNIPADNEEQKNYFVSCKDKYIKDFTNRNMLADFEQFFSELKDVQASIRECAIKYFQEQANNKMQQLTKLQAV